MKTKHILFSVIISAVTAFAVLLGFNAFRENSYNPNFAASLPDNYKYAGLFDDSGNFSAPDDFTQAAAAAIPAVVHIRTKTTPKEASNNLPRGRNPFQDFFGDDMFEQFFGAPRQQIVPQQASGSGVFVSKDGYIITNNHVVEGADEVTVTTSDRKTYTAKVIGSDPAFDLAVIKVDVKDAPFMLYGTSRNLKIGQWVLAVGYPLNLETTVTAGIISAKSRSLGLNQARVGQNNIAVESYIQTDAAVNRGNSGGPLINTSGELIGINSAIASPTGFYNGYSYAIPVDIVKKVVNDLIKFGTVQRGFLGIQYLDAGAMTPKEREARKIPKTANGIYVTDVVENGAAKEAGIQAGDIILKINDFEVNSSAELQEVIALSKPGVKMPVTYKRGNDTRTTTVTLKNAEGNFDLVKRTENFDQLGAEFMDLDAKLAREMNISGGVVVKKIKEGAIMEQTRMRDGFIITLANGKPVKTVADLKAIVANSNEVTIEGLYPGYNEAFQYPLILK